MRWGIEYRLDSGTYGLCIFSADNLNEAKAYVYRMSVQHGYSWLANLKPLPDGCGVDELKRLFPGYLCEKQVPTPTGRPITFQEAWSHRKRRLVEEGSDM
jgi:hypothetical protein